MSLVKHSDYCGKTGCQEETVVALAMVENHKGMRIIGPASNFLMMDRNKNPVVPYELKLEYKFTSWITRCAACYSEDAMMADAKRRQA